MVDEAVLEGRLGLARELLGFATPEHKYDLGSNEAKGGHLVKELIEDFIFPASKQMLTLLKTRELCSESLTAICNTPGTVAAAFELLVTLCSGCAPNMKVLVSMLCEMFYSGKLIHLIYLSIFYSSQFRSRETSSGMGLSSAAWAAPPAWIRWSEKCWRHLLYEFRVATTVYGGQYSNGRSRRGGRGP